MKEKPKVLIVDDEVIIRESLCHWLTEANYQVFVAANGPQGLEIIEKERLGTVISDLSMPGMDGIELMRRAKEIVPSIQVVIVTAYGSIPTAIAAMKEGAYDYIEKPFCPERVEALLERMLEHHRLIEENISLQQKLDKLHQFENIIAKSHKMQRVIDVTKIVARSNATVLVMGESGTGKELVARAIHSQSKRREQPFVAVSCAALPESLLESELFGHEKGAFTGAYAQKKGRFEFARRGTLFLDEIGEMSAKIQSRFLRVLEEKAFTRVGGNEEIKVDVRIVAATNKDLIKAMESGQFREDLYYRLNVVMIELPPLRERREDIPLLAEYFLRKFAQENEKEVTGFSTEAMDFLIRRDWTGNVRELENAIERAVILAKSSSIEVTDLPERNLSQSSSFLPIKTIKEVEKNHILKVFSETQGNYSETARLLGITRATLYNKLKEPGPNAK